LTSGTAPRMLFTKYARTTATSISCVGKRRRLRGLDIWCHSGNCRERTEPGSGLPRAGVTLEYSRKPLLHDSMTMERIAFQSVFWQSGGARLFVEDFLGFLHQFALAKFSIILVRFASAILESFSFSVYVFEWVCVLLIFHDVSPQTRILLFGTPNRPCAPQQLNRTLLATDITLLHPARLIQRHSISAFGC